MKKILIIVALAALIAGFFYFELGQYLTFEAIKSRVEGAQQTYRDNPILVIAVFSAIYVIVAAASLPGAALLTLAAGGLFGFVTGTIVVSFASTIGATVNFLAARTVLRDFFESKFGDWLKGINKGLERDGAFYLFTLRMVPAVPFFVINPVMGLTRIKTWTYVWVSQLGMLIGTAVYVNAGTAISSLESPEGIFTPPILLSFVLLAIVPWIAKAVVAFIQRRKVYKGFDKPKTFDRNIVIIGGGAAGL
ncbi:MAG: TVP38/TMEM64 family protein, partial [Erythrobacter sp.]|uniref:TVP38/TMEM64 family protein n=1 Tax=Erythrobacter sp. TaxID=1042 RepID=UPI003267DA71